MTDTVAPARRPFLLHSLASLDYSVIFFHIRDCRASSGPCPEPDTGYVPPFGFWLLFLETLIRLLDAITIASRPRLPIFHWRLWNTQALPWNVQIFGSRCVLTVASGGFSVERRSSLFQSFLVVRVLSSTLLPGFIGPESSVLPVNLPPFAPSPLRVLLFGSVLWHL